MRIPACVGMEDQEEVKGIATTSDPYLPDRS